MVKDSHTKEELLEVSILSGHRAKSLTKPERVLLFFCWSGSLESATI